MKNSVKILITIAILAVIITVNYLIFESIWFNSYLQYTELEKDDVEVLSQFDKKAFLDEYTNFNSFEFSVENLYENVSDDMKDKYPTLEDFKNYCNEKILSKLKTKQYYSLSEYIGDETEGEKIKEKYTIYYFDLDTYIQILEDESFDLNKSTLYMDVYLVENSIDEYSIEF